MQKRKMSYLIIALLCFGLGAVVLVNMGCGGNELRQGKQAYAVALDVFGTALRDYNAEYELAPAQVQETWRDKIDPQILVADNALKAWGAAMGTAEDAIKKQQYEEAYTKLFELLLEFGITSGAIQIE